jgi:hypothetical protein
VGYLEGIGDRFSAIFAGRLLFQLQVQMPLNCAGRATGALLRKSRASQMSGIAEFSGMDPLPQKGWFHPMTRQAKS